MHRGKVIQDKKDLFLKILFFVGLLTMVMLMYLESHQTMDLLYFFAVLGLFIKFLIVRLYL